MLLLKLMQGQVFPSGLLHVASPADAGPSGLLHVVPPADAGPGVSKLSLP